MIRSAGPPHTGLMCENEHFDGTWERIKPDLYRHNSLTFSDKGGKVFLSQVIGNLAHPDCIVKVCSAKALHYKKMLISYEFQKNYGCIKSRTVGSLVRRLVGTSV